MKIHLRRTAPAVGARAGFSLIECSIAILLMVFGVLTAFYSQITAVNLLRSLREHNAAVADLESCMEQVMLLPIDQMTVPGSAYLPGQPVVAFNNLHLTGETLVTTYPNMVGATTRGRRRVDPGRRHSVVRFPSDRRSHGTRNPPAYAARRLECARSSRPRSRVR